MNKDIFFFSLSFSGFSFTQWKRIKLSPTWKGYQHIPELTQQIYYYLIVQFQEQKILNLKKKEVKTLLPQAAKEIWMRGALTLNLKVIYKKEDKDERFLLTFNASASSTSSVSPALLLLRSTALPLRLPLLRFSHCIEQIQHKPF